MTPRGLPGPYARRFRFRGSCGSLGRGQLSDEPFYFRFANPNSAAEANGVDSTIAYPGVSNLSTNTSVAMSWRKETSGSDSVIESVMTVSFSAKLYRCTFLTPNSYNQRKSRQNSSGGFESFGAVERNAT